MHLHIPVIATCKPLAGDSDHTTSPCIPARPVIVQEACGTQCPKLFECVKEQLHTLCYVPRDEQSGPLDVLAAFEQPAFIHTVLVPACDATGAQGSRLRYELVRHRLTFELRDGKLESVARRGWHVRCSTADGPRGHIALPPGLRTFLALYPDSAFADVQILVPAGEVVTSAEHSAVHINSSTMASATRAHYAYSVHPRTGHLCAATVQSRLFLAALYAATGSALPDPMLQRTGGQMAHLLLNQSAVNRPLHAAEAAALQAVVKLGHHTPSLRLACKLVAEQSESVRFLYPSAPPDPLRVELPMHEQTLYLQVLQRTPAPFRNPRRALSD
jgi:hypothetical protein